MATIKLEDEKLRNLRRLSTYREMIGPTDVPGGPGDDRRPMTLSERRLILRQATEVIENVYVHLPHKRAVYGVDPVQRLALLRRRLTDLGDAEFHYELLSIFDSLRDMHTTYVLPERYHVSALLGIVVERYWGSDRQYHWIVSKRDRRLKGHDVLPDGAEITHWNGMPMGAAVARNGESEAGGNAAARLAGGLATMTQRCLALSPVPAEDWVDITVKERDEPVRLYWMVTDDLLGVQLKTAAPAGQRVGMSLRTHDAREYARTSLVASEQSDLRTEIPSGRPELKAWKVRSPHGEVGHLRVHTFYVDGHDVAAFLAEAKRLLGELVTEDRPYLIVDVRGNPGGHIDAADGLLRMLTDNRIEWQPMQVISSPTTYELCRRSAELQDWRRSLADAMETGERHSAALRHPRAENGDERMNRYGERMILITDALSYSATDMLAAGFQDNGLGLVLGTDTHTGAGGAERWTQEELRGLWPDGPFQELPGGAQILVAFRRSIRVGRSAGRPLEDLGVRPDILYRMTERDLTHQNEELMAFAASVLAEGAGIGSRP